MNKGNLVSKMAKEAGITKGKAGAAFSALIAGITASLKRGQRVTIAGFGTFSVAKRKARIGCNPRTGAPIRIGAHKVAKFAAGSGLRKSLRS